MSLRKAKRKLYAEVINRKIAWLQYCLYRQRVAKHSFLKFQINGCTGAYEYSLELRYIDRADTLAARFQELLDKRVTIKQEINEARKSFNPKKALRKYMLPW